MPAQRFHRGIALDLAARDHRFGKHRRFRNPQANENADQNQEEARQERQPPAPRHQIFARQRRDQRKRARGEQVADRHAKRRKAAPEAAMMRRRGLDQVDHRPAIFGAGAQALDHPHQHQQHGCPVANLGIGRQQADRGGTDSDHQQCRYQHGLAPELVAENAEHDAAQRPHHEADAESQERQERADDGLALGKEQIAEHQRGGSAVEEEVIPFERGSNAGRDDHAQARLSGATGCRLRHRFPRSGFLSFYLFEILAVREWRARMSPRGALVSVTPRA